jgi:hypothetical protein
MFGAKVSGSEPVASPVALGVAVLETCVFPLTPGIIAVTFTSVEAPVILYSNKLEAPIHFPAVGEVMAIVPAQATTPMQSSDRLENNFKYFICKNSILVE